MRYEFLICRPDPGRSGGSPDAGQTATAPHNVVIFIADGLRARAVNDQTAPNMAALAREGVTLANGHSIFPTFTTANASAMATGHFLGDTGDFSNMIYTARPITSASFSGTVTPFLENDAVLGEIDGYFGGDYLDETTVLALARAKGYSTAAIGKVGPVLMFDHTERSGKGTIIIDDATGTRRRHPALRGHGRADEGCRARRTMAPDRGANAPAGSATKPGTTIGQRRPAGLHGRGDDPRRAARLRGRQQAVPPRVLVARSRRHPAQPGRQPAHAQARHQRADLARGNPQRR